MVQLCHLNLGLLFLLGIISIYSNVSYYMSCMYSCHTGYYVIKINVYKYDYTVVIAKING